MNLPIYNKVKMKKKEKKKKKLNKIDAYPDYGVFCSVH